MGYIADKDATSSVKNRQDHKHCDCGFENDEIRHFWNFVSSK
jgi:hypothetical protein